MTTFLEHVAAALIEKFGNNLNNVTVVFPGKRASLFLNQALTQLSTQPVWAPHYRTISEMFVDCSSYALMDRVEAVCRLYNSYVKFVSDPQPLDQFWGWGEILLTDFDDVDKHLVDARQLFSNIRDIKELDGADYLTPEQEQALKSFFRDFSIENNSLLKERFLELWNVMFDIYSDFRSQMQALGLMYEGALQRDVAERIIASRFSVDSDVNADVLHLDSDHCYVFVGFNVLNDVEQTLFDELQRRHQALFFWDYDVDYKAAPNGKEHEAGYFVLQNIQRYGNALPDECFMNLRTPKVVTIAAASSENIQARYIPKWLKENLTRPELAPEGERFTESQTAVVLCNELLLQPVIHSLPSEVGEVNVTMGYPLSGTSTYSFVQAFVSLHSEGYDDAHHSYNRAQLRAVESHPFARLLADEWRSDAKSGIELLMFLNQLLTALASRLQGNVLETEAIFKTYTTLNRLIDLMSGETPLLNVGKQMLSRLLRSVLQQQTIPFHGEPAVGLQVMGVLETRALDFRHVLMLSVGEGYLPKNVTDSSFIPYHLRDAFGLTTLRHKIAVYAYYFYRLLQRAERITYVYNESNSGIRQNEISRFLRQLEAETNMNIIHLQLNADNRPVQPMPIVVEKSEEIMQSLIARYDNTGLTDGKHRFLSPSALNRYTTCPLQFYYRYICNLKVDPDPSDGLDAVLFGNVFHRAAELLYKELTNDGPSIRQQDIDTMLAEGQLRIDAIVSQAFKEEFFQGRKEVYDGILTIARQVVITYLNQLLRYDRQLTPIHILGLEYEVTRDIQIKVGDRDLLIRTGGIIDRLDEVNEPEAEGGRVIRVVDYKTGGRPTSVVDIDRLFSDTDQQEHYYFQTILYASIISKLHNKPVQPNLFFVHKSGGSNYSPALKLSKKRIIDVKQPLAEENITLSEQFEERLMSLVKELFDTSIPFRQCGNVDHCRYCDYRLLCNR